MLLQVTAAARPAPCLPQHTSCSGSEEAAGLHYPILLPNWGGHLYSHRPAVPCLQRIGSFPQQQITELQDAMSQAAASNVVGRLPPELQDLVSLNCLERCCYLAPCSLKS